MQTHPFHLLSFVVEELIREYYRILRRCNIAVQGFERGTGMVPWPYVKEEQVTVGGRNWFPMLLHKLQAQGVRFSIAETHIRFASTLLSQVTDLIEIFENLCAECGSGNTKRGDRARLTDQIRYNAMTVRSIVDKMAELQKRLQSQISVVRTCARHLPR